MADIADRFANLEIGPTPEPAPAAEPLPTAEPSAPVHFPEVADTPASINVPEVGVAPGNEVAAQDNPPPWVLPSLPAFGDWHDPGEDPPAYRGNDETIGQWRKVKELPSIWQPAPATLTDQLWQEYVGRGYRDLPTNLPDVGQQIAAGLPSLGRTRSALVTSHAPGKASRSEGLSLPSFDLFGGLFDGFAGLGLLLDGLIGLFSLSWLFGPSKAPSVRLVLYAVPLELGVMAYNALTNKGVRATAVEYVSDVPGVMEEFFFNVPDTQAEWTEYILRSIKLMWRRVDE